MITPRKELLQESWIAPGGYKTCGAFRLGVQYANMMELLDEYVGRVEDFKAALYELNESNLNEGSTIVQSFINRQWLETSSSLTSEWQVKGFGRMFATATVVFQLQCFHIIEKEAKELGIN